MLFLYLFKFLTFFFPSRKKTDEKTINQKQISKKDNRKKENHFLDTDTSLPEEENPIKEWEVNSKQLINDLFSLEEIDEIVNKVLKEEFELDIKKISTEDLKLVNESKKRIFPLLIHDIEYHKRRSKDEIATRTTKIIQEELWERPLLITSNKRAKKTYDIFFPNNPVRELKREEKKEIKTEQVSLKQETNPIKENTPTQEKEINRKKETTLNLREETIYRITTSTLVVASIANELKETQKSQEENEKKPIKKEMQNQIKTPPSRENKEKTKTKVEILEDLTIEEQMHFIELLNQEDIPKEKIIYIEQKIEKIKEEQEKRRQVKEKIELEEKKPLKELPNEKIEQEWISIPPFEQSIENMERNSLVEIKKEKLEEKDYESLEEQIDKMLYELELFHIKNDGKMTPEQEVILKREKEHLNEIKEKLQAEKKQDIEKDRKLFTDVIKQEEKDGLINKIKEMHLENQMDLEEEMINKIEDLERMDAKTSKNIEKKLIKKKMKRAIQAASIASLAALPFIRNRFFFAFSLGLFVQNHLGLLNNIIARSSTPLSIPKLDVITDGQSALEEAINTNYNNLDMLDILNKQALAKHPELINDTEYQYYVNHLNNRLNKNNQKLTKKYGNLEKYHKKTKKNSKILRRKENLQPKKDA